MSPVIELKPQGFFSNTRKRRPCFARNRLEEYLIPACFCSLSLARFVNTRMHRRIINGREEAGVCDLPLWNIWGDTGSIRAAANCTSSVYCRTTSRGPMDFRIRPSLMAVGCVRCNCDGLPVNWPQQLFALGFGIYHSAACHGIGSLWNPIPAHNYRDGIITLAAYVTYWRLR